MYWGDRGEKGDRVSADTAALRLAAAVAEIEGLHAALTHSTDPARRRRLLLELARAAPGWPTWPPPRRAGSRPRPGTTPAASAAGPPRCAAPTGSPNG